MAKKPFDKSKLIKYGLFLIAIMALGSLILALAIDDIPRFGFDD